jgi:hypothetical protein
MDPMVELGKGPACACHVVCGSTVEDPSIWLSICARTELVEDLLFLDVLEPGRRWQRCGGEEGSGGLGVDLHSGGRASHKEHGLVLLRLTLGQVGLCLLLGLSYGHPWAHYSGGYQHRLVGGPLGLLNLFNTAPADVERKDYRGIVLS